MTGFRQEIISDENGKTYNLYGAEKEGETSDYTGRFTLATTLIPRSKTDGLLTYKRISKMTLIFRGEVSGNATIESKADYAADWSAVGTGASPTGIVSLVSSADFNWVELACDIRCRHLLLQISATNRFQFVGVMFHYEEDDQR